MALIKVCDGVTSAGTYTELVPRAPYTIDIFSTGTSGTVAGTIGLSNNGKYFESSDSFSFTAPITQPVLIAKTEPYQYIQVIVTTASATAPCSVWINY